MKIQMRPSLLLAIGGLALHPAPSIAQEAPADAAYEDHADQRLQEVIVTAQYRAQNIQQTPLAISAVTGQMLQERGVTEISQLTDTVPSLQLQDAPGTLGRTVVAFIRGVGAFDFNPAVDPAVGFYVDNTYYASLAGTTFDLLDLDRVEVLRGPQGTLFGKNTIGGAIRLISKQADANDMASLQVTTGRFDRLDVHAIADYALSDDLFVRVSFVHKQQEGYVNRMDFACEFPAEAGNIAAERVPGSDCRLGTEGGDNVNAGRVAFRWVPNDRLEFNLVGDLTHDDSEVGADTLLAIGGSAFAPVLNGIYTGIFGVPFDGRFTPPNPYVSYSNFQNIAPLALKGTFLGAGEQFPPTSTNHQYGFEGTFDWKIDDGLSVKSITSYRSMQMQFATDAPIPLPWLLQLNEVPFRQLSQELQLLGTAWDHRIEWVAGLYFFHSNAEYNTITDLPAAGILYSPSTNSFKVEDESAFLHTITHLTDKLNFTAAVRYTVERKNFSIDQGFIYGGVVTPSVDVTAPQLKYNKTNPKFGLDYQLTEELMGYASYSTGFRGGGFNNRPFDAAQVFQIGPETLDSYEVGVKSQWFDHHLTVNLAGYDSEYHNFQTTVGGVDSIGVPFSSALNVGDARIRGAELELFASVAEVPGLQFSLTGSYTDGKITRTFAPPGLDVSPASLPPVGARMQNVPVWQGSLGVQYIASLGQLGTLTPRFDVSSNSSIYFSALNTPYSLEPGHTVSNVRLTWDAPRDFQVSVAVTNVFDRIYYTSRLDTYSEGLGYLDGAPAPPREWELSVKKTFK